MSIVIGYAVCGSVHGSLSVRLPNQSETSLTSTYAADHGACRIISQHILILALKGKGRP
jgi:hypothetical protein